MTLATKDPVKARAGAIGAAKRWGPPRIVRLGDLNPDQQALVRALVDAARAQNEREREGGAGS